VKTHLLSDSIDQILLLSMASLLFHRLLECATAIEGGNLDVADSLLAEIQSLASKEESIWTRQVVKYCAEALVRRAYGVRPPCTLPSLPLLSEPIEYIRDPLYRFATITSKHAIADASNSGNKQLHIIDLSNMFDSCQCISLIHDLKKQYGGLQSVRITSITPKLSKHSDHLRRTREWLQKVAGVNLELRPLICNSSDDIVNCISKLRRKRKDEIVVVNWHFTLHKLLAQDGAMEQVLSKVKDLETDIMVIIEQEANLNSPDLLERLEQSFQYYSAIFESLKKTYRSPRLWEKYFRRQIGNVVACEGVDRVERIESFAQWQNRLSQAGFCPVPQHGIVDKFKIHLRFYFDEYGIEEKEGHNILLSWHGCPLAVASVWKLTDPPQFSGGE
jgi:DELLA protein